MVTSSVEPPVSQPGDEGFGTRPQGGTQPLVGSRAGNGSTFGYPPPTLQSHIDVTNSGQRAYAAVPNENNQNSHAYAGNTNSPHMLDENEPTELKKNNQINIIFANVDGLSKTKGEKIKLLTQNDDILCVNETNFKNNQAPFLLERLANRNNTAFICSRDDITYSNKAPYRKIKLTDKNKLKGYGTGTISKLPNTKLLYSSKIYEIVITESVFLEHKILIINVYRSPSMKNPEEIFGFYDEITKTVREITKNNLDSYSAII